MKDFFANPPTHEGTVIGEAFRRGLHGLPSHYPKGSVAQQAYLAGKRTKKRNARWLRRGIPTPEQSLKNLKIVPVEEITTNDFKIIRKEEK